MRCAHWFPYCVIAWGVLSSSGAAHDVRPTFKHFVEDGVSDFMTTRALQVPDGPPHTKKTAKHVAGQGARMTLPAKVGLGPGVQQPKSSSRVMSTRTTKENLLKNTKDALAVTDAVSAAGPNRSDTNVSRKSVAKPMGIGGGEPRVAVPDSEEAIERKAKQEEKEARERRLVAEKAEEDADKAHRPIIGETKTVQPQATPPTAITKGTIEKDAPPADSTHSWANMLTFCLAGATILTFAMLVLWYRDSPEENQDNLSDPRLNRPESLMTQIRQQLDDFLNGERRLHLIIALQSLEAFKWFGSLAVLPLLLSNEYGYSDIDAAIMVGNYTLCMVVFGVIGSAFVDRMDFGVFIRLSCLGGFLARCGIVFCPPRYMVSCLVLFTPLFEGASSTAYRSAIVRLTNAETRVFTFSVSYSLVNAAGAVGFMSADWLKDGVFLVFGQQMSGLRVVILASAVIQVAAFLLAFLLGDISDPRQLKLQEPNDSVLRQLRGFATNPDCWRAMAFQIVTMFTALQWQLAETLLPKYLTRMYGTEVMWGTVTSLNLWICTLLPPFGAALVAGYSDFGVMVPGLAMMAMSPLFMVLNPTMGGSVLWILVMSIGEVIWCPRSQSYVATLAPVNGQTLFLSLVQSPRVAFNFVGTVAAGALLGSFVPSCSECQDSLGFFCDKSLTPLEALSHDSSGEFSCKSTITGEFCDMHPALLPHACPSSCLECPGWSQDGRSMWALVLLVSLLSPLLVIMVRRRLERSNEASSGEAPDCFDQCAVKG